MEKRLIIYFNYHPNGQADAACRFAVQQMAAVGQVFFVNNGPLQPESRQWAQGCCHTVLERETQALMWEPTGTLFCRPAWICCCNTMKWC